MGIIVFYLLFLFISNTNDAVINSYGLQKSDTLMQSAKDLNNFIENNKNLTVIDSTAIKEIFKKNKIYSYQFLPFLYLKNSIKLDDEVKIFMSLNSKNYNKIGYYYGDDYLVIILLNKIINIKVHPFKKIYKQYEYINIKGKEIKTNMKLFSLYISTPSDKIKKILLPIIDNKFNFRYKLKEKGTYIFEIISENNNDPKIISKITINSGKEQKELSCDSSINSKSDLLNDINRIRINNGLNTLKEFPSLSNVSYSHSKDMAENNFFSHLSSLGVTPYKRVYDMGIKFKKILENISQAPKLCLAHNEILESPGHLNNILDKQVNKIGLGIYKKNNLVYLTEDFILYQNMKSVKEYKDFFYNSISKLNIKNNVFLNRIANIKNYNEYYLSVNIPKKLPIYIGEFKNIKSYFFILNDIDSNIFNEIKNISSYDYYGYNISKFWVNNKKYLFLTVILANL